MLITSIAVGQRSIKRSSRSTSSSRSNYDQYRGRQEDESDTEDTWYCFDDEYMKAVDMQMMISGMVITIAAVTLAYASNSKSGVNSPIAIALLAFMFPEIYLLQAGVRAVGGTWTMSPPTGTLLPLKAGTAASVKATPSAPTLQ